MPTNSAPPEFYATSNFLFTEVPEPASLVLLIAGGTMMLQRQRKSA
ncbi:MAG: PEP-CTERM sorting domain-containing protein [Phycisphaeraceae bacterium]|nr:PEP-CTERM sorting domain-containing protein [Phycisphaeraceae bacterium]